MSIGQKITVDLFTSDSITFTLVKTQIEPFTYDSVSETTTIDSFQNKESGLISYRVMFVRNESNSLPLDTSLEDIVTMVKIALGIEEATIQYGFLYFPKLPENDGGTGYVSMPPSTAFDFGTGAFTISWKQHKIDVVNNTRVFTQGAWPDTAFGVSQETTRMIVWINGTVYEAPTADYQNTTRNYMICREGTVLYLFEDGDLLEEWTDVVDSIAGSTDDFIIGAESPSAALTGDGFAGYIGNFHIIKGTALHVEPFTVPEGGDEVTPGSVLLLQSKTEEDMLVDETGTHTITLHGSVEWAESIIE